MSLADDSALLLASLSAIRDSLREEGAVIPSGLPLADWPAAIAGLGAGDGSPQAPGGSAMWTRPADRPARPAMADDTIAMLFGVGERSPNDLAFAVTCTGGYTVDWGDGGTDQYASAATAEHVFSFEALAEVPVDAQGYRMVWVTVRPTQAEAAITVHNTQVRPAQRPVTVAYVPQVFEMYVQCPQLTSLNWGTAAIAHYRLMEIFSLDENAITAAQANFLTSCTSLRKVEELHLENAASLASFMVSCTTFNSPFPDYLTFENAADSFLQGCECYDQPFPERVRFPRIGTHFMYGCLSYNQPFPEGCTFGTVTDYFMYGCRAYNRRFPAGTTLATARNFFMGNCYAYNQPFPETVTLTAVAASFMNNCYLYNQPFPAGVRFAAIAGNFMTGCSAYNQRFPDGVTFAAATASFLYNCTTYNQPFPEGVTFQNVAGSFMQSDTAYNQRFPDSVTFASVTTHFMYSCSTYNQPFRDGLVFPTAGDYFMGMCSAFNHGVAVSLAGRSASTGINFIGTANYAQKWLRLPGMTAAQTALAVANSAMDVPALVDLFDDLYDRTGLAAGTLNITGCYGAARLTTEQRAIATGKNWTLAG